MEIRKRFPTDIDLQCRKSFLTNKSLDGELYGYLQSISYKVEDLNRVPVTVIDKKDISKTNLAKIFRMSSKTISRHLDMLIGCGYVVEDGSRYILPNLEETYLLIPYETIKLLVDTVTQNVIKVYLYLGKRFKYKENYNFTKKELCNILDLNVNYSANLEKISNILFVLQKLGLIKYHIEYIDSIHPIMILDQWNEKID